MKSFESSHREDSKKIFCKLIRIMLLFHKWSTCNRWKTGSFAVEMFIELGVPSVTHTYDATVLIWTTSKDDIWRKFNFNLTLPTYKSNTLQLQVRTFKSTDLTCSSLQTTDSALTRRCSEDKIELCLRFFRIWVSHFSWGPLVLFKNKIYSISNRYRLDSPVKRIVNYTHIHAENPWIHSDSLWQKCITGLCMKLLRTCYL